MGRKTSFQCCAEISYVSWCAALQSQKAVAAYLSNKQLVYFGFLRTTVLIPGKCLQYNCFVLFNAFLLWFIIIIIIIFYSLFTRQVIVLDISPTWNCVSLTRFTTSGVRKKIRFNKMEVNSFQIIFTFNMFKIWHLKGHIFLRKARYSRRRSSGPCGGRCVIITYH